jgi:hypothetical protein
MSGEAEDSVVGGLKRLMEWFSLAGFFEHDYTCVSQDDASFGRRLGGRLGLRRWIVFFLRVVFVNRWCLSNEL